MIITILKTHILPALIKNLLSQQKEKNRTVKLWGTGKPKREILHVDQVADACEFFLRKKQTRP